ncbi:MAG: PhoH family protein, partial [Thermotogaceae bacterium]|nr:PhoH family protein [Thermotogaceae bacterium]
MAVKRIEVPRDIEVVEIFGYYDKRIRFVRKKFDVEVSLINNEIWIRGKDEKNVNAATKVFKELIDVTKEGKLIGWDEFEYIVDKYSSGDEELSLGDIAKAAILGKRVRPKTKGQKEYIEAIQNNDVVFVIGPAGTGKTYLAVAMALDYLRSGRVQRIILTRPAVEAGEKLGFLPGDLIEKVDPYLRPLYDSIMDMIHPERFYSYREKGIIEIAPLAYMRGRTLNNSFVILDEAQNTTYHQMKMFLTRLGFNSKAIITGDITQLDIEKEKSGLI